MRDERFRSAVASLWFRLVSLGMVGLVFAEALFLAPGKVQNWSYYLTAAALTTLMTWSRHGGRYSRFPDLVQEST